jgi:hypothetical protein
LLVITGASNVTDGRLPSRRSSPGRPAAAGAGVRGGVRLLGASASDLPVASFTVESMSHASVAARLSAEHVGSATAASAPTPTFPAFSSCRMVRSRPTRMRCAAATAARCLERSGPAPGCPPRPMTSTGWWGRWGRHRRWWPGSGRVRPGSPHRRLLARHLGGTLVRCGTPTGCLLLSGLSCSMAG